MKDVTVMMIDVVNGRNAAIRMISVMISVTISIGRTVMRNGIRSGIRREIAMINEIVMARETAMTNEIAMTSEIAMRSETATTSETATISEINARLVSASEGASYRSGTQDDARLERRMKNEVSTDWISLKC